MRVLSGRGRLAQVKTRLPLHRLLIPLAPGAADDAGLLPLPEKLVIAPWGRSKTLSGAWIRVGKKTMAALAANQKAQGFEEVALDFNHNTYAVDANGKPVKPKEPIKVAAYGTLSVQEGVGIVFHPTRWTPEGAEHYQGGHYRDLSPTIATDADGEVIFVHSAALCRQGQIENLHAYSVEIEIESETKTMDPKALLLKLLNLPDTATDEEIAAAVETLSGKLTAMAAQKPEENKEEAPAAYSALAARLDAIEKQTLITAATAAGKVIPLSAEAIEALPLAALKTTLDALKPGEVPTKAQTQGGASTESKLTALSAEEKEVCRQLGITEEQFRKA